MSHYSEVVSLLDATGFTVHRGSVPDNPPYPYAVLWWPGVGRRRPNSLRGTSNRLEVRFRVTSVSLTDVSVQIVAQAMQDALLDQFLTVSGWVNHQILHTGPELPTQEDRDVTDPATKRHPLYTVDAYQLSADRAV